MKTLIDYINETFARSQSDRINEALTCSQSEHINEYKIKADDENIQVNKELFKIHEKPYATSDGDTVNITLLNSKELLKEYPDYYYCLELNNLFTKIRKDPKRFLYNIRIPEGSWYVYFDHYHENYHINCAFEMISCMHNMNEPYKGEMYSPEDIVFVGDSPVDCFLFLLKKDKKWLTHTLSHGTMTIKQVAENVKKSTNLYDSAGWIEDEIENEYTTPNNNNERDLMKDANSLIGDLEEFGMS